MKLVRCSGEINILLSQNSENSINLTTIAQGTDSNYPTASQRVITSTAAWVNLWQQHSSKPVPEVDFTQEQVVAVFAGKKPTASYSVNITRVENSNSNLVITVEYHHSEDIVTLPITHPYHIIKSPRITVEKVKLKQN